MPLPAHTSPHLDTWRVEASVPPDHGVPVLAEVDVLVVGLGAAGVAAATVAAEEGLSVLAVERYGFAGGAAVAGMSGTICGLYLATDDAGDGPTQVVAGFTERFRSALDARGGLTTPQRYGKTWTVAHDPLMWRETADALLTSAGVRVMYHAVVSTTVMDGSRVRGVILESNAGRVAVHARRTIDASGDAAVVARAGGDYFFGDGGRIQNPTMFFRLGGVDTDAFWDSYGDDTICPPWVTDAIHEARGSGADLPREKVWIFRTTRPAELLVNATRLAAADGRVLNVIDPEDFTIAEIDGRRQVRSYARFLAETLPGCADAYVVDTGVEAGIRQTRSIVAEVPLTNDDVVACRKRDDAIVRSPWPIELHDGERPKLHWLLDDWYEVPYGSLVPDTLDDVIVAGRCLGAEHEALASARVTAQCFEYGHAAARAAILSLTSDRDLRDIDVAELRRSMRLAGSSL
ncbi:FAD-dependent oxidoreductase [Homoserinibacter sp. GY 40078]|uniref:FAD-dependent oxidoreductase n=1 Tax=Homoserinibacter sp. GY 40078 TaxID=2603275 RepID=UPI0011C73410|nr:FAD-dependent oxidoreductase [Homoserinibacter sp. GY 40078]TXK18628.1 FAD-dependent oxidoreductase [Homoserinibacter sp. GY 40078]